MQTLKAELRTNPKKSVNRSLRLAGKTPAVIYGPEQPNTPLFVDAVDLAKLIKDHGKHSIIKLSWDGQEKAVAIGEVQAHPLKNEIIHIDFQQVNMRKKIQSEVPISWQGEDKVSKAAVLQKQLQTIEVECLPSSLPSAIEIDVSQLAIGETLRLKDITLPPDVTLAQDEETVIVTLMESKLEEEPLEPQVYEEEPGLVEHKDDEKQDE